MGTCCEGFGKGVWKKIDDFRPISRCISETVIVGTCSETICKHRILFPSIQHLAWLPQGLPRGNQNVVKIAFFGLKHRITRKLLKIDGYMLRVLWQALNCLSIHATYRVIIAGASPGKTKMWAAVRETAIFCTCGSNNWETVQGRWVHAARGLASTELSSFMQRFAWFPQGRTQDKRTEPAFAKVTILLLLIRAAFSN